MSRISYARHQFIHCFMKIRYFSINCSHNESCIMHSRWNRLPLFCLTSITHIEQLWSTQTKFWAFYCTVFKTFLLIIVYSKIIVICNQRESFWFTLYTVVKIQLSIPCHKLGCSYFDSMEDFITQIKETKKRKVSR